MVLGVITLNTEKFQNQEGIPNKDSSPRLQLFLQRLFCGCAKILESPSLKGSLFINNNFSLLWVLINSQAEVAANQEITDGRFIASKSSKNALNSVLLQLINYTQHSYAVRNLFLPGGRFFPADSNYQGYLKNEVGQGRQFR